MTLAEIASKIGATVVGDADAVVSGLGALMSAQPGELTHLSNPSFKPYLADTQATAVILSRPNDTECPTNALVVDNPYHAFAVASQLFEKRPRQPVGIHESAFVDATVQIGKDVRIGPMAIVHADTKIADGVEIGSGVVVGEHCIIGADCVLMPRAVLYYDTTVGERCVIHSGAIIGADGFGFTPDQSGHLQAMAQIGGVTLGNDVSVGACTTIDRGTIDDTVIDDGVKIDNQVQIGHNCRIGAHSVICGCVGIVGSTVIGRHCLLAGGVGIGGDVRTPPIEITDGVTISGMTHVSRSIGEPGVYSGGVLHNKSARWKRNALRFTQLDDMAKRLARLEKEIVELKSQ